MTNLKKTKTLAIILVSALIIAVALNVYQYTLNLDLSIENKQFEMQNRLDQVQSQVKGELQTLDQMLLDTCIDLSSTGLTGTQAREVLSNVVANNSLIVNAATADANYILLAVEPSSYKSIEGEDISGQEQNLYMHQTMRPAMSNMIPLVEGFPGVVMVAPVFDADNQFIGSLSFVIQPRVLIEKYVTPAIADGLYSMWSMQLNGTLIYDPDPEQQDKNLLTDPIYVDYPEVQAFTRQVAEEHTGYGTYSYYDKNLSDASSKLVNKEAYWTTIGLYNTQWRLVIVHTLN